MSYGVSAVISDSGAIDFDRGAGFEARRQVSEVGENEGGKFSIGDVPGRDVQQFPGSLPQEEGMDEIGIFRYHDPLPDPPVLKRKLVDDCIWCAIGQWQVEGVQRVEAGFTELERQLAGELRVYDQFHATAKSIRFTWLSRAA